MRFFVALMIVGLTLAATAQETGPGIDLRLDTVLMKLGERPQLQYRYGKVDYKPYVDRLWTPGGVNVLRDSPEDHVHHHALMYAINADEVNFWEEYTAPGQQKHEGWRELVVTEHSQARASATEVLRWLNPAKDNALVLDETRRIEAIQTDLPCTLISWRTELSAPREKGQVVLGGSHYHGLGMRFVTSMDEDAKFLYAPAEPGEVVRGTEQLTPGNWCAVQATADGKPVTVAMFDHPANPRAVLWFTMTESFAYLSATINLHREPLTVATGTPFTVEYGVAAFDGAVGAAEIEQAYQQWLRATGAPMPEAAPSEGGN
jgi:hypothetical protein